MSPLVLDDLTIGGGFLSLVEIFNRRWRILPSVEIFYHRWRFIVIGGGFQPSVEIVNHLRHVNVLIQPKVCAHREKH